jgi:Kef-type K+ transport system membrane component KefB/mannitol/fructose-specific phosphotransferase system IIA component (Ntr-type)
MDSDSINNLVAMLALQLGIIFFAVRLFGRLARKFGIPQILGELLAGIIIGPYALGGLTLPGFPQGLFASGSGFLGVSNELYAFASIASIVLLFASGLETNIGLFLRYALRGGVIGLGGALISFIAGGMVGTFLLDTSFMDPRCLFLGILATTTSMGISARILSDQKKIDSPEGVTVLAATVFDDVLGIVALAVVLGIVTVIGGGTNKESFDLAAAMLIAGKAFGIWLGFTVLGVVFSKKVAAFLKLFKSPADFSILALGLALILAGLFEKQGLALKIGAYIAGLSLSKTDIAPVVQERIRGVYDFFVPVFFVVMGMMVNFRDFFSPAILVFGAIYTVTAVLSKFIGCSGPALLLGFNIKGALRIGMGMIPRGELVLIIASVGLGAGIFNEQLFAVIVMMTLITILAAPPLMQAVFKMSGSGTRAPAREDDLVSVKWEFSSKEIADLVIDNLLKDLNNEGFYIQVMNIDEGLSQARKDDITLYITEKENIVTIDTFESDMPFVKTAVYEVIVELHEAIHRLEDSSVPLEMKKELLELEDEDSSHNELLAYINPECINISLKGGTKKEIITELVDMLAARGKLIDRDTVLNDVLEREEIMNTGMDHGIALPHAKTDGVEDMQVAVGIKKEGIDFGSLDGEKSRLFILMISPKRMAAPYLEFLAAVSSVLHDKSTREAVINANSTELAAKLLRAGDLKRIF